jgi:glycosyltransferase involved in cell wall biosynthesis
LEIWKKLSGLTLFKPTNKIISMGIPRSILIDGGFSINLKRGIGRYTASIYKYLKSNAFKENITVKLARYPLLEILPREIRRVLYIFYVNSFLPFKFKSYDIVHFTNYCVPFKKGKRVKYVATIHDLTAWRFPETLPKSYLFYFKWSVRGAIKNADLILTVSNSVKNEIIEFFGVEEAKIRVCMIGIDENFIDEEAILRKEPLILSVSVLEKKKNHITLIKAFDKLKNIGKLKDWKLVLVGKRGFGWNEISDVLERSAHKKEVLILGYIKHEDLVDMYRRSSIFVSPSLYEGFDIPVLEAMASGSAVIVSDIPIHREVGGDAALYYSPPEDENKLAEKLLELVENDKLRYSMAMKGYKRAKNFTWKKLISEYISAYKSLFVK